MFVTRRLLLVIVALVVMAANACAEPVAPVMDAGSGDVLALNSGLSWWQDAPAGSVLADAQAGGRFVVAPPGPSFGVQRAPVWFRVALRNDSAVTRDFMLEAAFAKLDFLDVYLVHADGRVDAWQTGEARPFAARPVALPRFVFPLALAAGEQAMLYLRVESSTVLNLPLKLHEEHAYLVRTTRMHGWLGAFYGLVLGLLAYNAFLFRTTRDRAFLHYTVGGFLAVGYFASIDGYVSAWFPETPWVAQHLLFFCGTLSVTFVLLFARGFLDLARRARRTDRAMLVIAGIAVVATLLVPFVPMRVSMAATIGLSVAMSVVMAIGGVICLRAGFRPARWFVLAIAVHLATLLFVSVGVLGLVPGLFEMADNGHRVDFVLNLVCFTLALGERIRLAEQERRSAEDRATQAAADIRARNEFLARMSHELRTPMTGVLGMTELLEHTELAPQQRRYLATLRYSGEMMLNLVSDVLDHARIEEGRLQLRREAFDLLKLIDECRMLFEQQPRSNGVTLRIDTGTGVSRVVVGDAQRIRQVLVNLLATAFRFTVRGSVTLRLRALATPGWVRFEVQGAGMSLDATDSEQVFGIFADGPTAVGGSRSGTGLGLGICRRLCELMGGRIGIQGAPDGTLLWFELPLYSAG